MIFKWIALCAALVMAAPMGARAQSLRSVVGVVTAASFDPATGAGTLELDTDASGTADTTLDVLSRTEIRIGGTFLSPAQVGLLVGARVEAVADGEDVVRRLRVLSFRTHVLVGTVVSVDEADRTLEIRLRSGETVEFEVAAGADLRVNGHRVPLRALQPGERVEVVFVRNGAGENIALAVRVQSRRARIENVTGTLVAVDVAAGTLRIRPVRGSEVTLTVVETTDLRLRGRPVSLALLAAALADATAAGGTVHVSAQALAIGDTLLATRLHGTVRGAPRRGGHGGGDGGRKGRGRFR